MGMEDAVKKRKLTLTHSAIQHTVGRGIAGTSHFLNHGGECSTSHTNDKGVELNAAANPSIEQPPERNGSLQRAQWPTS